MAGTTYLLLLLSLTATVSPLSIKRCYNENRPCWKNGGYACKSPTEPCRGECPRDNPIMSEDGKSCSKCDGDICPECAEDEWYCRAKKKCQKLTLPCDGQCGPMRGNHEYYCPETGLCQSRFRPCGGKCGKKYGLTYCSNMKQDFYTSNVS